MQLFYAPDLTRDLVILSEEESRHCAKALRLKLGDEVHLFDGKGLLANGIIDSLDPKSVRITIHQKELKEKPRPYQLEVAVAPAKNPERNEWFVEKAIECGIDCIQFIETTHSERSRLKMERLNKIVLSALKQSKQFHLPALPEMIDLQTYLEHLPQPKDNELRLIAYCAAGNEPRLTELLPSSKLIRVLIGPEGDFNEEEVKLASQAGFRKVSLGGTILRTETAALFACMAAKAILEH